MNSMLVPSLALDLNLLNRLANSIDYPIEYKVIINNGKKGALDEWNDKNPEWRIIDSPYNLGCAGAWNLAPEIFIDDAWLICNEDQDLQPGVLETICKESDLHHKDADIIYVDKNNAFDIFVWTRNGVKNFGTFDENFYPIYYEDWEMRMRFWVGGGKPYNITKPVKIKHGKPYPHNLNYVAMIEQTEIYNRDYYTRKWGIIDDKNTTFKHPFNNPSIKVKDWILESDRRDTLFKLWNNYFNQPDVSIK